MDKIMKNNFFQTGKPVKRTRIIICFILLTMFAIGFLTISQYGHYWDEATEMKIVELNAQEYAFRLFNTDSPERISNSIEKDHGVAILYPMQFPIFLESVSAISKSCLSLIWYGYIFCVFFSSVLAMYYIGKTAFHSYYAGLLAASAYYFTPRMFAEGHYNNKDILLLTLTIDLLALVISAVKEYRDTRTLGKLRFFLMSIVAGFLMNLKVVGICIVCLYGLILVCMLYCLKMPVKRISGYGVLLLTFSLLFYYIFTPAMWGGIRQILSFHKYLLVNATDFSRWDDNIFFNGQLFRHSTNPLPKSYLIQFITMTTPIYILVFCLLGTVCTILKLIQEKASFFDDLSGHISLTALCLFLIPTAFATFTGTHIYNGWRHFYFVYAGILIESVYGIVYIYEFIKKHSSSIVPATFYCVAILVLVGTNIVGIAMNHPFQYAYFNAFAPHAEEKYELDYWNVSTKSVVNFIVEDSADMPTVPTIGAIDVGTMTGLSQLIDWSDMDDKFIISQDEGRLDYLVENITYSNVYEVRYAEKSDYVPIKTFDSYGNKMFTVYKRVQQTPAD